MRRLEAKIYAGRFLFDRPRCQYRSDTSFGIAVEGKLGACGPYAGAFDVESPRSKNYKQKPKNAGHEMGVFLLIC